MKSKLWSGRFEKQSSSVLDAFNASISFDERLYREDIEGSIAHATMLFEQGILTAEDFSAIEGGLREILSEIESGTVSFSIEQEDIHMNIESILTERIGEAGKRLHTARSRNDQVALDFRLYVKRGIDAMIPMILELEETLVKLAKEHLHTIMPSYTHLQRAQPSTFAHYMMAYANMFRRDITRLEDCRTRMDECPLGAGALASTTYPIDRTRTAELLGFQKPTENSLDSVSDRDYAIELMSALSIFMMHMSRFSEEIILWSSFEFGFIELDDAYATGSSMMPQKKNPDIPELVRGKTGRVYGSLIALLTMMKALPLAYNKDMQEDKEPVFDAMDTVSMCIPIFNAMLSTLTVRSERMKTSAHGGFLNATDCADYLVKKGLPFRDAYGMVGKLVLICTQSERVLEELTLAEFRAVSDLFGEDIFEFLEISNCVRGRKAMGGPSPEAVSAQIASIEAFLSERK